MARTVRSTKPAAKAAAQSAAKAAAKPVAKSSAKVTAKPKKSAPASTKTPSSAKKPPKAVAKSVAKSIAKPLAKSAAKTHLKTDAKPGAKKSKPSTVGASATKSKPVSSLAATKGKAKAQPKAAQKLKPAAKARPKPKTPALDAIDLEVTAVQGTGKVQRRVLRPKSFPEVATQMPFGHMHVTPELPAAYGADKLVLMPKDPEWLFTYWELTPKRIEAGWQERAHGHQYQEALKLTWQPQGLFEPNYVFLPVEFTARKWYVAIPGETPRSYRLEIGWLGENGHFISLLQSDPAGVTESWMQTRERLLREGAVSAYTAKHTVNLGASEQAVIEESRGLFLLENLSSGLFSSSSLAVAQPAAKPVSKPQAAATARIEVKGHVPKGSTVRLGGQEFVPDAQGRFKASVDTQEPTLHLEVISSEGEARFFAYDLNTPVASA